jgi:hypothetical protein
MDLEIPDDVMTEEHIEELGTMATDMEAPEDMKAEEKKEEMCCDGSGRTAEQHRAESADGKCCIDG